MIVEIVLIGLLSLLMLAACYLVGKIRAQVTQINRHVESIEDNLDGVDL